MKIFLFTPTVWPILSNYEFVKLIIRLIGSATYPNSRSLIGNPWPVKSAGKMI